MGLWAYAATGLISDHATVQADTKLATSIDVPAYNVFAKLETERRLTMAMAGNPTDKALGYQLKEARDATDTALKEYEQKSKGAFSNKELQEDGQKINATNAKLAAYRKQLDSGKKLSTDPFTWYSDYISQFAALIGVASHAKDGQLAQAGNASEGLLNLVETISREDALISSALPSGKVNAEVGSEFVQYVAIQQHVKDALLDPEGLPGEEPDAYARLQEASQTNQLASFEKEIQTILIKGGGAGQLPADAVSGWRPTVDAVNGDNGLSGIDGDSFQELANQGNDRANTLLLQFALGSLAVIAALLGTYVVVRRTAGAASHRMSELQQQIKELAEERLPEILAQLDRNEEVDLDGEIPAVSAHSDDLERLGISISRLGRTFETALVRQARGREGTEKVFANLTRRTQILVHRLISLLDDLERKHEDSDLLQDIFKIDHLATRVRRHSENLVILGGASPGRRGTNPLSVTDVIRGAVSETEQYRRVSVHAAPQVGQVMVATRVVTDLTHLMAELIENGTTFSPPDTQVQISVRSVARGLAVHVEDRGLGMPTEQYEHLNALLAKPPQPDMDALGRDPRLGLFVVAKLAERHGLKASLRESDYGGTLAVVLLPTSVLEETGGAGPQGLQQDYRDQQDYREQPDYRDQQDYREPVEYRESPALPSRNSPRYQPEPAAVGAPRPPMGSPMDGPGGYGSPAPRSAPADLPGYPPEHGGGYPQFEGQGFPDYGGAGLLPSSSDGQEAFSPWGAAPERSGGNGYAPPAEPSYSGSPYPAQQSYNTQTYSEPYPRATSRGQGYGEPQFGHVSPSGGPMEQQDRSGPLDEPSALPTRRRGASLAKQLRDEAPPRSGRGNEEDLNRFTPGRSAANIMAIQRETRRARDGQASGALDSPAESRHNGTDEL